MAFWLSLSSQAMVPIGNRGCGFWRRAGLIWCWGRFRSDDMLRCARLSRIVTACIDYASSTSMALWCHRATWSHSSFYREEGGFLVGAVGALLSRKTLRSVRWMDIPLILVRVRLSPRRARGLSGFQSARRLCRYRPMRFKNPASAWQGACAGLISGGGRRVFMPPGQQDLAYLKRRAKNRRAIGVDSDQWDGAPGYMLTSMVKRIEVSVYNVIAELREGRFDPGVKVFGLRKAASTTPTTEPVAA